MIHVEDALLASRTMMTPLWLEVVANKTEFTLGGISIIEWPVSRYLARVRPDNSQITPKTEEEENSDQDAEY